MSERMLQEKTNKKYSQPQICLFYVISDYSYTIPNQNQTVQHSHIFTDETT